MNKGGKRPGAGRPLGGGIFGEPTHPMRVPHGMIDVVAVFRSLYAATKDVLTAARLLVEQLETNEKKK